MGNVEKTTPRKQNILRNAFLIIVFFAAVATAWVVVKTTGQSPETAAKILTEISQNTLDKYYAQTGTQWYIIHDENHNPVGWKLIFAQKLTEDGDIYEGGTITGEVSDEPTVQSEYWQLKSDLSECKYLGSSISQKLISEAYTTFSDRKVTQRQSYLAPQINLNKPYSSSAQTPDNYIPEGAFFAVLQHVAETGKSGRFLLTIDNLIPTDDKTQFAILDIEFKKKNSQLTKVSSTLSIPSGRSSKYDYWLNSETKTISEISHKSSNTTISKTSQEAILKHYPKALAVAQSQLNRLKTQMQKASKPAKSQ